MAGRAPDDNRESLGNKFCNHHPEAAPRAKKKNETYRSLRKRLQKYIIGDLVHGICSKRICVHDIENKVLKQLIYQFMGDVQNPSAFTI
jgi:hypothetical protein